MTAKKIAKSVSAKTRLVIWTRAAGRCQYEGCNKPLLGDIISGKEKLNKGYVAHIVAREPDGPRGDQIRSSQLVDDINNLMLTCDEHHRLIDHEDVNGHPETRLLEMKRVHENRISLATDIQNDMGTCVLLYGARIGEHDCPVRYETAKQAVLPKRYPLDQCGMQLHIQGCSYEDHESKYWDFQVENLQRQFEGVVRNYLQRGAITHISVFALAPQPLLIELGRLLSDIPAVNVFQLHREPQQTWQWQDNGPRIKFVISKPLRPEGKIVALKLALSATVTDKRITKAFHHDSAIV